MLPHQRPALYAKGGQKIINNRAKGDRAKGGQKKIKNNRAKGYFFFYIFWQRSLSKYLGFFSFSLSLAGHYLPCYFIHSFILLVLCCTFYFVYILFFIIFNFFCDRIFHLLGLYTLCTICSPTNKPFLKSIYSPTL